MITHQIDKMKNREEQKSYRQVELDMAEPAYLHKENNP